MKVTLHGDNLIQLTYRRIVNCYLVRQQNGWTLVDTCQAGSAPAILAVAERLGAIISRISFTHAHGDHVGSLDEIAAARPDAEVSIAAREARLLGGDLSLDEGEPQKPPRGLSTCQVRPQRLLQDGDMLGSLRVIATPGHTPGHTAFLDERDGTLVAGDALFTQGGLAVAGTLRLRFCLPTLATWDKHLALQSARRLAALKPTRLATGHGPVLEQPTVALQQAIQLLARRLEG